MTQVRTEESILDEVENVGEKRGIGRPARLRAAHAQRRRSGAGGRNSDLPRQDAVGGRGPPARQRGRTGCARNPGARSHGPPDTADLSRSVRRKGPARGQARPARVRPELARYPRAGQPIMSTPSTAPSTGEFETVFSVSSSPIKFGAGALRELGDDAKALDALIERGLYSNPRWGSDGFVREVNGNDDDASCGVDPFYSTVSWCSRAISAPPTSASRRAR